MTTDTAVRVARMVILDKSRPKPQPLRVLLITSAERLEEIPYIDFPELRLSKHESTQMPFRYVQDSNGAPIMPHVRLWYPRQFWLADLG
jgi:ribosome biogenesis SPOUT family RNA methylase Rps3